MNNIQIVSLLPEEETLHTTHLDLHELQDAFFDEFAESLYMVPMGTDDERRVFLYVAPCDGRSLAIRYGWILGYTAKSRSTT